LGKEENLQKTFGDLQMSMKIGLEIHVQLNTKSKLFCSCSTDYRDSKPNSSTCPICLGFPGSKPKVNKKALDYGISIAHALNCEILPGMSFSFAFELISK
jgi:aspartyl-tRNA(Asn)/glutamyl-tRNA(Gln) amidotransferase subunit B